MHETLTLWKKGAVIKQVDGIEPRLASWNGAEHPDQVRLRVYLAHLMAQIHPLPPDVPLFVDICVDVEHPARLLVNRDLENYLTPLFGKHRLDSSRFPLVRASKRVGGGSAVTIGIAEIDQCIDQFPSWQCFSVRATGSAEKRAWKEGIRGALAATNPEPLPDGPVDVQIAFGVSPRRNWVMLWKPVGDTMGPVLGEDNTYHHFHPRDDRIVSIAFHRTVDSRLGYDVALSMWWRMSNVDA